MERHHMTFDIVFGVGGREVADRALEHWLTHVALSNVAGKFTWLLGKIQN
jgi:hypothetical protein